MTFLLWIIGISLAFRLIFRLWGRQIGVFLSKRIIQMVADDAKRQHQAYDQNYTRDPFNDYYQVDQEVKVSAPKNRHKTKPNLDEVVEDIDYEEVRN